MGGDKRLIFLHGGVLLQDEERDLALIPGRWYDFSTAPVTLVQRLHSTQSGLSAWWQAGEMAREALNEAPYQPVFRGRVTWFMWLPPNARDTRFQWGYEYSLLPSFCKEGEDWVVQGGSGVTNWVAQVAAPFPDPLREALARLAQRINWENAERQGSLDVARVWEPLEPEVTALLPYAGSGYRSLFNHHIYPLSRWAWRAIGGTAYAVFEVPQREEAFVTSPDHEEEWLSLVGGTYIARHPIPRGGAAD
jgi:hypothetical protein